jgi:hypothetical protein
MQSLISAKEKFQTFNLQEANLSGRPRQEARILQRNKKALDANAKTPMQISNQIFPPRFKCLFGMDA